MYIVIGIEESVAILQCYVAYIYSASGPNRLRSHAVAPRKAEPTAPKGCAYILRITETSSVYLIPRAQSLRHLEIQHGASTG